MRRRRRFNLKEERIFVTAILAWFVLTMGAFTNIIGLGTDGNLELSITASFGIVIVVVALCAFLYSEIRRLRRKI